MAHIRQSSPDYDLVFQVNDPKTFQVVSSSLGSSLKPQTLEQMYQTNSAMDEVDRIYTARALNFATQTLPRREVSLSLSLSLFLSLFLSLSLSFFLSLSLSLSRSLSLYIYYL